ncbi:unnamed protein product [Rhodiola kirilowii]
MGCCASRDGGSESSRVRRSDDKAASFTSMEEETVKEVLSETPARPACFVSRDNASAKSNNNNNIYRRNVGLHEHLMMKPGYHQDTHAPSVTDEISEAGSLYENMTATMAEGRDSNEYYRNNQTTRDMTPVKYPKSKSFSGEMGRQKSGHRSPAKNSSDPSPRRRNGGTSRSVSARDSPQKAAWGRPESGERSGRRSRSPGMRAEGSRSVGVGRSPSGRKMQGQSPNRGRGTPAESSRRSEQQGGGEGKWAKAEESIENPLVALECFIFL